MSHVKRGKGLIRIVHEAIVDREKRRERNMLKVVDDKGREENIKTKEYARTYQSLENDHFTFVENIVYI